MNKFFETKKISLKTIMVLGQIFLMVFQLMFRMGKRISVPSTNLEDFLIKFSRLVDLSDIAWASLFWIVLLLSICYGIYKKDLLSFSPLLILSFINVILAGGFSEKYLLDITSVVIRNWESTLTGFAVIIVVVVTSKIISKISEANSEMKNQYINKSNNGRESNNQNLSINQIEQNDENFKITNDQIQNLMFSSSFIQSHPFFTRLYQYRKLKAEKQKIKSEKIIEEYKKKDAKQINISNSSTILFAFSVICVLSIIFFVVFDAFKFEGRYFNIFWGYLIDILEKTSIKIDHFGLNATALIMTLSGLILLPILFVLLVFTIYFMLSIIAYFFANHQKMEGFVEDIAYLIMLFFFNSLGAVMDFILIVPEFVGTVFRVLFEHDPSSLYVKTIKKMKQKIENFNWRMK